MFPCPLPFNCSLLLLWAGCTYMPLNSAPRHLTCFGQLGGSLRLLRSLWENLFWLDFSNKKEKHSEQSLSSQPRNMQWEQSHQSRLAESMWSTDTYTNDECFEATEFRVALPIVNWSQKEPDSLWGPGGLDQTHHEGSDWSSWLEASSLRTQALPCRARN